MKFTYDQLLSALEGAIEERGEHYIYPPALDGRPCHYVDGPNDDLSASCQIGHALYNLGISLEELREYDGGVNLVGDTAARDLPYWADRRAAALAARVQGYQDDATEWGRALSLTLRDMNNH